MLKPTQLFYIVEQCITRQVKQKLENGVTPLSMLHNVALSLPHVVLGMNNIKKPEKNTQENTSCVDNRFTQVPKHLPYREHTMTQIPTSLMDSLPRIHHRF